MEIRRWIIMVAIIVVVAALPLVVLLLSSPKNTKNETDNEKPKATITPGVGNVLGETQISHNLK